MSQEAPIAMRHLKTHRLKLAELPLFPLGIGNYPFTGPGSGKRPSYGGRWAQRHFNIGFGMGLNIPDRPVVNGWAEREISYRYGNESETEVAHVDFLAD